MTDLDRVVLYKILLSQNRQLMALQTILLSGIMHDVEDWQFYDIMSETIKSNLEVIEVYSHSIKSRQGETPRT